MSIGLTISFLVVDSLGQPAPKDHLEKQLDLLDDFLIERADGIVDIDVDAVLSRGEVSVSMVIVEAYQRSAAFVAALDLLIPAIEAAGGDPIFGEVDEISTDPDRHRWKPLLPVSA